MSEKTAKKLKSNRTPSIEQQPQPAQPAQPAQQTQQTQQTLAQTTTAVQPPEAQEPTARDLLALMVKQQEETRRQINTLAEAIVKINEKVDAKGASSSGGGEVEAFTKIANMFAPKSTSLDDFAKMAEGFARAADAIEHFRRPSRIGAGEAYLMRLGVRAGYPRYMTKAELARMERAIGITEAFEGEGESEHVSE